MSTGEPVVDFVMPVYEEGENIAPTLEALYAGVPLCKRVLVVHDRPDDGTVPVVRRLLPDHPGLALVHNTLGAGVVNALRAGFAAARAEVVVVTMADQSDDIGVAPRLVSLIRDEGYDVACPSRYVRGGRQLGGPWLKGALSRAAGVSLHHAVGLPTHDATNSFRAYRRSFLQSVTLESTGGWEATLELTVKAFAAGLRITEVPCTWRDRTAGASRFQLARWLPRYLRWYGYALRHRNGGGGRRG